MLIPGLILAVSNGVVLEAVLMDYYEGADYPSPYGFKHLVDADVSFDIVDFDDMEVVG